MIASDARYLLDRPTDPTGALDGVLAILWHGAGGDADEASLLAVSASLTGAGATVARARFGYRRAGRRAPDRMPILLRDARETIELLLREIAPRKLVLGGRSMGGRTASMSIAGGLAADGLILLSYPLHPAGRPEQLRDEHLPKIACPMLFIAGDKDPLSDLVLLERALASIRDRSRLEVFSGTGHTMRRKGDIARVAQIALEWTVEVVAKSGD